MSGLKRLYTYTLDQVLPLLHTVPYFNRYVRNKETKQTTKTGIPKIRIDIEGHTVCVNSLRLVTFKTKGIECVVCGLRGSFFAAEISEGSKLPIPHINLYAEKDGKEVLMTHDHIIPTSKGGKNILENTQPMCCECNVKKGDKV